MKNMKDLINEAKDLISRVEANPHYMRDFHIPTYFVGEARDLDRRLTAQWNKLKRDHQRRFHFDYLYYGGSITVYAWS